MMKRFWILALCALVMASHQADAMPRIVEEVVKNKEFFAEFEGYEDCYLFDVSRLDAASADERRIGLILLDSEGLEVRLVVKISNGETVYRDVFVPEKTRRETMKLAALRVMDARKLAKAACFNRQGRLPY